MRFIILFVLCGLIAALTPISTSGDSLNSGNFTFSGTFVYLEDGLVYQYRDGQTSPACRVARSVDADPLDDPRNGNVDWQVTRVDDMDYSSASGLVVLATNHTPFTADYEPPASHPNVAKNVYLCDLASGEVRQISPEPSVGFWHEHPVFSPDGQQVVWLATGMEMNGRLLRYDISTETVDVLHEGLGRVYGGGVERQLDAVVWDTAGIAARGYTEMCGDRVDTLVIFPTGSDEPITTCLESPEDEAEIALPVLYWVTLRNRTVLAYWLVGPDPRTLYLDPETREPGAVDDVISAQAVTDVNAHPSGQPRVNMQLVEIRGYRYLAAMTSGPSTLSGHRGGFAFSDDGRVLAMLATEGINFSRGGTDLYLFNSDDAFGSLGYQVNAQRVTADHPWGPSGVEGVFWGRHRYTVGRSGN